MIHTCGPDLLADGGKAADIIAALPGADNGRDRRQMGIVDAAGSAVTYTGSVCRDWAGGAAGDGRPGSRL